MHKGKASAPCEFGVKVSIVTTNARAPGGHSCCCRGAAAAILPTATPCATSSTKPKNSPGARSSGPMSTRGGAVMTRKIHAASSSQDRSAACRSHQTRTATSIRDRARDRLPQGEGHLGAAISKVAPATPPTPSSRPSDTTSGASSQGCSGIGYSVAVPFYSVSRKPSRNLNGTSSYVKRAKFPKIPTSGPSPLNFVLKGPLGLLDDRAAIRSASI